MHDRIVGIASGICRALYCESRRRVVVVNPAPVSQIVEVVEKGKCVPRVVFNVEESAHSQLAPGHFSDAICFY